MTASVLPPDAQTRASVTIAWVIIANKPFYPVYIWWLVGTGVQASLVTLIATPFLLLVPYLASRKPQAARLLLLAIGTADTMLAARVFGEGSAAALFFAPCIMLVAVSFRPEEAWLQRIAAVLVFLAFALDHVWPGTPFHAWSASELAVLRSINILAVASLMTFIAIRYAGVSARGS